MTIWDFVDEHPYFGSFITAVLVLAVVWVINDICTAVVVCAKLKAGSNG